MNEHNISITNKQPINNKKMHDVYNVIYSLGITTNETNIIICRMQC